MISLVIRYKMTSKYGSWEILAILRQKKVSMATKFEGGGVRP